MFRALNIKFNKLILPIKSEINHLFETKEDKFCYWVYSQTTHINLYEHYSVIKRNDKSIFDFQAYINEILTFEINQQFPDIKVDMNNSLVGERNLRNYKNPNWDITYTNKITNRTIARLIVHENFNAWKLYSNLPINGKKTKKNLTLPPDGIIFFHKEIPDNITNTIYSQTENKLLEQKLIIPAIDYIA